MLESFSIINFNTEAINYDNLSTNEKLIGSFDYLGEEKFDNFLIDRETGEIEFIGLSIPQNFIFENDFFKFRGIELTEHKLNDLYSTFNNETIFQEPNFSILDSKFNRLICLASLEIENYQAVKINDDFSLLFDDWKYSGFVLNNAFKKLNEFDKNNINNEFEINLYKIFELVNTRIYDQMENEDELILKKLNSLKKLFLNIHDSRRDGIINFIDNCLFAYY